MDLGLSIEALSLYAAVALTLIALVYALMGFGWRRGEFVWKGRHPRRLPGHLRRRSLLYALLLVATAFVIVTTGGLIEVAWIPASWAVSTGFVVTAFLGLVGLVSLFRGGPWERFLFAPLVLASAGVVGLLTFG